MNECYVRGSTIKYLRIPDEVIDMVKEENIQRMKAAKVFQTSQLNSTDSVLQSVSYYDFSKPSFVV